MREDKELGFTLIELMIVIAIVGILSAIALPTYQTYIAKSQVAEGMSLLDGLKSSVTDNYFASSVCPDNLSNSHFGIAQKDQIVGSHIASVHTRAATQPGYVCEMEATFKPAPDSAAPLQGNSLLLSMKVTSGAVLWHCSSANLPGKYLPDVCRH